MTVQDFYQLIDRLAPFDGQEEYDNSGFLVGSGSKEVSSVLLALDVTDSVINDAVRQGAQLIITHHPLMFSPVRSLTDADYESRLIIRLIREEISLIAAHTNLDRAPGGMNDVLAERCGLTEVSGDGFFRCGFLPSPMSAGEYALWLQEKLGDAVRLMGPADLLIRKAGLCSGGGSDEWPRARDTGCDAFICGEIKHHHALAMADSGIIGLECGHFATEEPGIRALASALQSAANQLQCNVRFYVSDKPAYVVSRQP